jgi:hypothetical protein
MMMMIIIIIYFNMLNSTPRGANYRVSTGKKIYKDCSLKTENDFFKMFGRPEGTFIHGGW